MDTRFTSWLNYNGELIKLLTMGFPILSDTAHRCPAKALIGFVVFACRNSIIIEPPDLSYVVNDQKLC